MIFYLLIAVADILYAAQFFFEQRYQKQTGAGLTASLIFSGCSFAVIAVYMLCLSGFTVEITPFGCMMAFFMTVDILLCTYCGIKALEYANLSLYSVFIMLGGMFLPFLLGIFCYSEPFTAGKAVCCVMIALALLLGVKSDGKGGKKAVFYYAAIFILNGLSGVISKVHQSYPEKAVPEPDFLFLSGIFALIICAAVLPFLLKRQPVTFVPRKDGRSGLPVALLCGVGFGLVNGTAQLIALFSLESIPASVQYPLITGGVMIVSSVIGFLIGERPSKRDIAAVAAAFVAVIAVVM